MPMPIWGKSKSEWNSRQCKTKELTPLAVGLKEEFNGNHFFTS